MLWFFIVSTLAAVSALEYYDGPCPDVKSVENFDGSQYLGKWYEKYTLPESSLKCIQFDNSLDGNSIKVNGSYILNDEMTVMTKTVKVIDDDRAPTPLEIGNAILKLTNIVATDYTNYAVDYTCNFDKSANRHYYKMFVSLRTTEASDEVKNEIENYFTANIPEVNLSKFSQLEFTEDACKYSSVSQSNGI